MRNGPQVITNGLVLALDAADKLSYPGSGNTWRDISGNNNDAIRNGTTSLASWNERGYFEHRPANYFGAADSNSNAPDSGGSWWQVSHSSSLNPNGGFWTVGGWLKVIGTQTSNGTGWFHKQSSVDERAIHLEPISNQFRANASNGWTQIFSNISTTNWANYCFVFTQTSGVYQTDAGNLKFYVNGSLIAEDTDFRPASDTGNPIYLGRRNGHLRHFLNGDIANYQFYMRSLTSTEVQQNFNALRGRFEI